MTQLITQGEFRTWIEHSLETQQNILAVSNQGTVLRYREDGVDLVIKTAMGKGLVLRARQKTLLREFDAYQRLVGLAGVPECHGMIGRRYLVLDFVRGTPYREASWRDRETWFEAFLGVLRSIHERGVSHGDLKSKANILVTEDERPCIIDFGTSFVRRRGYHPVNNWLFEYGKRLDLNAWVKHKYHGRYADASNEDRRLLNYGRIEYLARKFSGRPMDSVKGPRRNS